MHRIAAHFRLLLLTLTALALAAPAFAQQTDSDADFQRTLRELNADIDYGAIYRGEAGNGAETAPGTDARSGTGAPRTYEDPGKTRESAVERDIEATGSGAGPTEQQLLETIRDADRITQ